MGKHDLVQGIKWSDRWTGPVAGRSDRWTSTVQAAFAPEVEKIIINFLSRFKRASQFSSA